MGLNIIVTVKQVPDTHNISCEAMKPDGTVNRAALPAIFNPEDLNALEEAICLKEAHGGRITAITMGPPMAVSVLRECLFRGADDVILISDRRFAGADTLATSYALACAIRKVGAFDLVLCGRQAIDGDTAQVGPQIAEKLGVNQITSVSKIQSVTDGAITAVRTIESGQEVVRTPLPALLTITNEANEPRTASAKRVMAYKRIDRKECDGNYSDSYLEPDACGLAVNYIREWNADTIEAEAGFCGMSGSPTKVKKVENVVLTASGVQRVANTEAGITELIRDLIAEKIIG